MKVVILAGGLGSRLSEETQLKPKPMVEIGGRPILWHIMKIYSAAGFNDFIVCLGYRGYVIKEFFANYHLHMADVTIDLQKNATTIERVGAEPWRITLVDTGDATMTGGRLKRVKAYLSGEQSFCMTYGDGLARIDIKQVVNFHEKHGNLATITAVQPPGRFGALAITEDDRVQSFQEKPIGDGNWINGGFFVLSPKALDYIEGDHTVFEAEPLTKLSQDGMLKAYRHTEFWQAMDTLRDKRLLDELWESGRAPWKIW